MKRTLLSLCFFVVLTGCVSTHEHYSISQQDVPDNVMLAAKKAVIGMNIKSIEVDKTDTAMVYEIGGTKTGVQYQINVSDAGEVISITKTFLSVDKSEATFSG